VRNRGTTVACLCTLGLSWQLGCVDARVSQRLWQQTLCDVSAWTAEGAKRRSAVFSTEQLRVMVGEPDHVTSVSEFVRRARGDHYGPEWVSAQLNDSFKRLITVPQQYGPDRLLTDKDGNVLRLDQCELWLYEESSRFSSPLPNLPGVPRGFGCYVFFVRAETVLGATSFARWHGLAADEGSASPASSPEPLCAFLMTWQVPEARVPAPCAR
jgi:hypothetical protein